MSENSVTNQPPGGTTTGGAASENPHKTAAVKAYQAIVAALRHLFETKNT